MTHTPHELAEEFPLATAKIRTLKTTDAHFARLVDQYHEVNRQVHAAETFVAPMSREAEDALRKSRMRLKDEIARLLAS